MPQGAERKLDLANRMALRPREVAEALGISERKVRDLLPELPRVYLGTAIVVPVEPLKKMALRRIEARPRRASKRSN